MENDTLSGIAQKHYDDPSKWPLIQNANDGLDPNRLRINQSIRIPKLELSNQTLEDLSFPLSPDLQREWFERNIHYVLRFEGGLNDDPTDRGNAGGNVTNFGVTQAVYDEWCGKKGRSNHSVSTITQEQARELYFECYWQTGKCQPDAHPSAGPCASRYMRKHGGRAPQIVCSKECLA